MSIHELTESEYDKVGNFYVNWLDKNVPDRVARDAVRP